ncbi:MAG: sugar phosphate isomerase/epimerase [Bryobacterales bacterium]|nr:sugar phosphate isomerase/epimerase [Bryobacterales bacterium]
MTRRNLNFALSGGGAIALLGGPSTAWARTRKPLLGFKQYGMKKLPVREAIRHIAAIGYKAVSLTLMPTWDTEPKLLSTTDRAEIRKQIGGLGLVLSSVQESLRLAGPEESRGSNLDHLRAAAAVAHELSPGAPAVIETPVGGRPEKWEETRHKMADELGEWAKTLEPLRTVLAIEGHVGTALDRPEKVLWLLDQVKSPWIGNLFDYSHYHLQRLGLGETLRQLASRTVLHHVKDSTGNAEKFRFLLPGDSGEINYKEYAQVLGEIHYQGPLLLEVSAQIFNQPDYDGLAAAKRCWDNMAPYFA